MANIVPFDPNSKQVPAHLQKFFETHSNIQERTNVPQLSFRGKVWRIVINGEEKPLLNKEGDPVAVVHIVALDHNKARSRAYYEGSYEEGKSKPPACWSTDGEVPDEGVKEPRAASCQACEFSKKGSKITPNGKEVTACSVFKRVAVVPLSDLDSEPLLLKLPQTSVWDKNNEENEAKGYYAWDQYIDMLRTNGAKHTAAVATKVKFDTRMAYPKLLFAASRWLADEETEVVGPLLEDERVGALLEAPEPAVAARSTTKADTDDETPPAPARGKPPAAAKGKTQEYDDETPPPPAATADDDDSPPPPPSARGKGKAAAPPVEDEEAPPPPAARGNGKSRPAAAAKASEEDAPPPPAARGKGKPKAPEAPAAGTGLADLVSDWSES
jgi:hypothetical protein